MFLCGVCRKRKVYLCSDEMNAWCGICGGNYFHYRGEVLFLGNIGFNYSIRKDGSVIKVIRKEEGNKTTIIEEKLPRIESKIKIFLESKQIATEN